MEVVQKQILQKQAALMQLEEQCRMLQNRCTICISSYLSGDVLSQMKVAELHREAFTVQEQQSFETFKPNKRQASVSNCLAR